VDAFPSAVLEARWPEVPNLGDMTKFMEWPEELLADCDLLVGGTPCQAFSVAGLRRSLDDARGNLSLVYVNLWNRINEVRRSRGRPPAVALWENVPGVLSTKDNAFGCFVGGLLGCDDAPETQDGKWPKAGFLCSETVRVGWRVLDAQYFAVAQRRRRVFLVAVPCELVSGSGGRGCPSEILSLRESLLGNPPTRQVSRESAPRDAASCAGESGGTDGGIAAGLPDVVGTLSDGAHNGGGLNGQDAYSGRVIAAAQQRSSAGCDVPDGWNAEAGPSDRDTDSAKWRFL
jgi:DNA (cytosine-5)-methyltransferase 1